MRLRHPTRKTMSNPTDPPQTISCGTKDKGLLIHLLKNQNSRFNLRSYSNKMGVSRSSIYDMLNRLKRKGFVSRETANNKITEKGKIYLSSIGNVCVGSSRGGCRTFGNLSTHYHKFKLPRSDKKDFNRNKLKLLNPLDIKDNKLHNLHQIIINPKIVIINLFDIITEDVSDSDLQSIDRMLEYVKKLSSVGLQLEGSILEEGHWARIESHLSDFLFNKVDNKYFLDLGNNKKFWIDHSDKREDETNDKEVRERFDSFLTDMVNSDAMISDIDKIIKALSFITKIEATRMKRQMDLNKADQKPSTKPDYFG